MPDRHSASLQDPARLSALRRALQADASARDALDRLARVAARALGAPAAQVNLVSDERQIPLSSVLHGRRTILPAVPLEHSYCRHVVASGEPLLVADAREHPLVCESPATIELGIVAYAAVPLTVAADLVLGTLCVVDFAPRDWSREDVETLEALADFAVGELQRRGHTEVELLHVTAVLESGEDAVIGVDLEGRVTSWNPGAERMLGFRPEEILGRPVASMAPPEGRSEVSRALETVQRGEAIPRIETERVRKDGSRVRVSRVVTPVRDLAGRVIGATGLLRDLTERTEMERTLRENERKLTTLLDNLPGMVYRCRHDSDWTMEFVSQGARALTGYAPAELVGEGAIPFASRIHVEDLDRVWHDVQAAVSERRPFRTEYRIHTAEDEERSVWEQGQPIFSGDGGLVALEGFITDVTEQRRTEAALQESEARFRQLAENVDAVFWLREHATRRLLYLSPGYERIWGQPPEQLLEDRCAWADALHPDDRERVLTSLDSRPGAEYDVEYRIIRPDGEERWIRDRGFPVRNEHGEVERLAGIAEDVTERRQARDALHRNEARFRALIEHSAEIITVLAVDGSVLYESPAVERVLGYTPEERLGRDAFSFVHPDDEPRVRETFAHTVEEAQSSSTELRVRHRDGSYRILSVTGTSLLADPAVAGVVVNSHDVTELREGEDRLRHAQKMEAVGRLAGGIAHDFNNVLMTITATAQLLLMDLTEPTPLRDDIEEINQAAGRAASLTRQLLAFSRQQELRPEILDLNRVVLDAERMLRRVLGEDIEFVTALDPALRRVSADRGHIEQILMNLAVNARDAMPAGGTLTTETRNVDLSAPFIHHRGLDVPPGRYLVLSVSDSGAGMPEHVRKRVFEPFFTTKEQGKGTGLGLSTVYGIAKQSGGSIEVESEHGRGAVFRIYLPEARDRTPSVGSEPGAPAEVRNGSGTVLLVEDDRAVRTIARRVLERAGYTVVEAGNGEEALKMAAQHQGPVDLLLTDVVMPVMGGRELARRLTRDHPGMRVLYTSGYTDEAIAHHGVLEPGIALLPKPYGPAALMEKLAEVLPRSGGEA